MIKMNKRELSRGAIISYLTIIVNILTGLLYTPWMIHKIGDSNYALYNLAISIIGIFMMDFGLSASTSRFLSQYYAENDEEKANNFMGLTLKLYLYLDIILFFVMIVLYFFLPYIYKSLTIQELETFKNLFVIVAFYSLISFPLLNLNGVLIAKEKFIAIKLCGLLQKLFTVILVVISLYLGGNVYELVLANAVGNIAFSFIKLFLVKKNGVKFKVSYKSKRMQKELIFFSIWSTIVQILQRCIFSIAPTLLAMFVNSREIVFFSLASTIEGYVWTIGDAINGMFMPQIAKIELEDEKDNKITNLMCKVGKYQTYIVGAIFIVFLLIGQDFVTLWMGEGYKEVYICTIFIIFPALIDVPQQIGKTVMLIRNQVKLEALIYIFMVGIYIPLAGVLTKIYGVIGTAFSISIAYIIRSILMTYAYKNNLNIDIKKFFKKVYIKWILVFVITVFVSTLIIPLCKMQGLLGFVLKFSGIMILYTMLIYLLYLNKEEKKQIINIFIK